MNGNTTTFTMNLNTGLTQALSDGTNNYIYGLGRIAQVNTATEYFLGDALGSVRQLTDESGDVTYASAHDPYGVTTSTAGSSQSAYGYTGEFTSNDLVYLRARMYAPSMGRFLTRDTWSGNYNRPLSFNRWMYVEGNPMNSTDPTGRYPLDMIRKNIPLTEFAKDHSAIVSPIDRSRWGFLAALRSAQDYDYIRVGALDLISLYPKLTVSATEQIWSINCETIMVGRRRLSEYFADEVQKQRMPYIYWRDTSARYYDLFGLFKPSRTFVDGGFENDYPAFRSVSAGIGPEINIIADINGQLHASLSLGRGATFGVAYTEGYLCRIRMEGCAEMPSIPEVTSAINGFCFPAGSIEFVAGIAVALCEAISGDSQDPVAWSGVSTYYVGLQASLGAGFTATRSLPYQNPMLGWSWAVQDQLNGWNVSTAWMNYRE